MIELDYGELYGEIEKLLLDAQSVVLATCAESKVTARTMCTVNDGLTILFSTSRNSEKADQIKRNPNVAFVAGNMKIEATAEWFGHPRGHTFFREAYPKKFPHLGAAYPETPDDLLIIARPSKIALFKYLGKACEDVLLPGEKRAYRIKLT